MFPQTTKCENIQTKVSCHVETVVLITRVKECVCEKSSK